MIPILGLGTWNLRGASCRRVVRSAIDMGYRHIDTARMYENEREVGQGIADAAVSRDEIFLTTKLWTNNLTRQRVGASTNESLKELGTDTVDLLLIHWPSRDTPLNETLDAMMAVAESGKARAIGVSNFPKAMWQEALELAPVRVNQVEFHPFLGQDELLSFARERELELVGYSPLAKGRVAKEPVIIEIANRVGRTPGQVALRWLRQQRVAAIPKAASDEHLRENLETDFELDDESTRAIASLAANRRLVNPGWAPMW